jgi:hypothetical protein
MWDEIQDMPGEIFDIEMTKDEREEFNLVCQMTEEEYIQYMEVA